MKALNGTICTYLDLSPKYTDFRYGEQCHDCMIICERLAWGKNMQYWFYLSQLLSKTPNAFCVTIRSEVRI